MGLKYINIINLTILLVLVLTPFQWISIISIFGLSLKPVHIIFGAIFVLALFERKIDNWQKLFLGYGSSFIWLYAVYIVWYLCSLFWQDNISLAIPFLAKHTVYFLFFIIFSLLAYKSVKRGDLQFIGGTAALIGTLIFIGYMIFAFFSQGLNLFDEYLKAIMEQDERAMVHSFYPLIFNYKLENKVYLASLRNGLIGMFILYCLLLLIWQQSLFGWKKLLSWILVIVNVTLVITSVSRSNLISLALAFLTLSLKKLRMGKLRCKSLNPISKSSNPIKRGMFVFFSTLFIVIIFIISLGEYTLFLSLGKIVVTRIEAIIRDARLVIYRNAIEQLTQNIFWGYGIGQELAGPAGKLFSAHNLFLASWLETGLIGFVLSLGWYSILFLYFVSAFKGHWVKESNVYFPYIIAFPILPLFRILVSGSGKFTLTEWVALSLFFGIMRAVKGSSTN